jgi:toxin HigB-1
VIRSFRDADTERIFKREFVKGLPREIQRRAFMKLNAIDAAVRLEDLRLPASNRLEALKGDRKGEHSTRINDQWRICFLWREGHAERVQVVDYH